MDEVDGVGDDALESGGPALLCSKYCLSVASGGQVHGPSPSITTRVPERLHIITALHPWLEPPQSLLSEYWTEKPVARSSPNSSGRSGHLCSGP